MHTAIKDISTRVVALSLLVLLAVPVAEAFNRVHYIDSFRTRLEEARQPEDSVRLLFNLLDLTQSRSTRAELAEEIYHTAIRAHDVAAELDAVMYHARNVQGNLEELTKLKARMENFKPSARSKEIALLIDLLIIEAHAQKADGASDDAIGRLIQQYNSQPPKDIYDRIKLLFAVCTNIAQSSQGSLLEEYYIQLMDLVKNPVEFHTGTVRSLIYSRAAPVFTNNRHPREAIEIDKRIIALLDSLTRSYQSQGRVYRSLDGNRYLSLRRILANYHALSPAEIRQCYATIQEIAKDNRDVQSDLENNYRTKLYYAMATKDYDTAMEKIKQGLATEESPHHRSYLLFALAEAAEATGQTDKQLRALKELNEYYRSELDRRSMERGREYQLVYDLNALRRENTKLAEESQVKQSRTSRIILWISISAALLLLATLVVVFIQYRKKKALTLKLTETADNLRNESAGLQEVQKELIIARDKAKSADRLKTEFINVMTHEVRHPLDAIVEYSQVIVDCVPDDRRKYLDRFANIIELSANMIQTLMNDVFDVSNLESDEMSKKHEQMSIYNVCECSIDSLFDKGVTKKGVPVVFNAAGLPDEVVYSDSERVAQVLLNLLSNADKFTESGQISLDFEVDREKKTLSFIVTDTGIGVNPTKAQVIFERFEKLDPTSKGTGLGLYICKLVANLLDGTIALDTDYGQGARFVFTIPLEY